MSNESVGPQIYVFDLDGTLCPHGKNVDPLTAKVLKSMKDAEECQIHLCTASTIGRTRPRIQELIDRNALNRIWCGHSTSVLDGRGEFIQRFVRKTISDDLVHALWAIRKTCEFTDQGTHPIAGDGSCYSFSIVGKKFTPEQREAFIEFDRRNDYRRGIVQVLRGRFPEWDFYMGGQTGIDFVPKGYGKVRVINNLLCTTQRLTYYGDDFGVFGGDEEAKYAIERASTLWRLPDLRVEEIEVYRKTHAGH